MANEAVTLDALERRVLGVLLEKDFTQPQAYPMTVNAITLGCNQKNNRDPLMELDEDTVWDVLSRLRERGLVTRLLPQPGARADKFKHNVPEALGWQSPLRAILTELLLRGPQTIGELRTRCARFVRFDSTEDVAQVLATAESWTPPLVRPLPRAAGQAAVRYTHLLHPSDEAAPAAASAAVESLRGAATAGPGGGATGTAPAEILEALQRDVDRLREELSELRARMGRIESQLGP